MKEMNLLYLVPQLRSDPNRTQFKRLKALSSKYILYMLVTKPISISPWNNLRIIRIPFTRGGRYWYVLWAVFKGLTLRKKERIHVVYSGFRFHSCLAGYFLKMMGFKWIVDLWDHPELSIEKKSFELSKTQVALRYLRVFIVWLIEKIALKRADLVILALHPDCIRDFNIEKKNVLYVTNGVDLDLFHPTKADSDRFTVFYVGFVQRERGVHIILKACKLLENKIPNLHVTITGDIHPQEQEFFLNQASSYVTFTDRIPHAEVIRLMNRANICLFSFPRRRCTDFIYPVKLLEYMAMRKPIVATNLTGVSSIIKHRYNGLLVSPNNAKEMADAIYQIYSDSKLANRLGANAWKTVQQYDWDQIHTRILKELEKHVE